MENGGAVRVLNGASVENGGAEQTNCKQEHMGKGDVSLGRSKKLLLEAFQPENADWVGACEKDPDVVILLVHDRDGTNHGACEKSIDY